MPPKAKTQRPISVVKHEAEAFRKIILDDDEDDDAASAVTAGACNGMSTPAFQTESRNQRSNAPAPSERSTEPGPMIREIRRLPSMPVITSPISNDESFFNKSFQDIGRKLKAYNDTLGELQQLGVSHDIPLPELVLVGDQSAGKSSLMSGLANLDLPRSEGTCTRCPLHIRVSRNSDWSCRVSLRKEFSYQPPADREIRETDVTDEDPFFPWRRLPHTAIQEFRNMTDKSQIEDVLRWAQIAILNDDKPHDLFVPGSGNIAVNTPIATAAEETLAKFSPNIVALEIKGPDLPDLSFYDMPGIFQNPADARDDYLVNVVRNLSKTFIEHPSAIIICAMPMNSDAENSSTFGLTRRLNASARTIGVLTKADLLPEGGNHDQWLAIMNKETHHTGLGYFITSRPQGKDLDQLERWEELVFETYSVGTWPPAFHKFGDRCGVDKLKSFLSERLGEEFSKSLPFIKQKVEKHHDKISRQLSTLPELPKNVELEIQNGLMMFADLAKHKLDDFMRHFNTLPTSFRDCLLHIKPKFTLKDKSDFPVYEISDDESDAASVAAARTPKRRMTATNTNTPSKRTRLETPVNGTTPVKPEETNGTPRAIPRRKVILPEPFTEFTDVGRGFRTLAQVRDEIEAKKKAGMPGRTSDQVYEDLVMEAVQPWKGPTDVFIKQTMRDLHVELSSTLSQSLEKLKRRLIYKKAKGLLQAFVEEHKKKIEEDITVAYQDETQGLLTFNQDAFELYKNMEAAELTRYRHHMRLHARGMNRPGTHTPGSYIPGDQLTEDKRAQDTKKRDAEVKMIGPDMFAREIEVVAYCRGYYRLAALRFADAVAQRIIHRAIPAMRRELPWYLRDKLGLGRADAERVHTQLMEEDDQTARKRETLKAELEKFNRALASIEALETGAIEPRSTSCDHSETQPPQRAGLFQDVADEDGGV